MATTVLTHQVSGVLRSRPKPAPARKRRFGLIAGMITTIGAEYHGETGSERHKGMAIGQIPGRDQTIIGPLTGTTWCVQGPLNLTGVCRVWPLFRSQHTPDTDIWDNWRKAPNSFKSTAQKSNMYSGCVHAIIPVRPGRDDLGKCDWFP